jgi:hypothetical protein
MVAAGVGDAAGVVVGIVAGVAPRADVQPVRASNTGANSAKIKFFLFIVFLLGTSFAVPLITPAGHLGD